jgi:hypothetical protein
VGAGTPENDGAGGRMEFLDRHNVECPFGKAIAQFKLNAKDNGNRISYSFNCIAPAVVDYKLSCYDTSTSPSDASGFGFKTEFLDRQNVKCGDNQVMQRFQMASQGSNLQYNYRCCNVQAPRGLVLMTNLPKQTVWADLGGSRIQFLDRHSVDCLPNAMSAFKLEKNGGNIRYIYTCSQGDQGVTWSPAVPADTPENDGAGGRMEFLDRHNVQCPAGSAIAQFKLNAKDNGNRISYSYNCITPAIENKMTCYDKSTSPSSANGFGFNTEYLDRQNVKCGDNEVMQRFRMASNMAANSLLYEYKCCAVMVDLEAVQKRLAEEARKKAEEEAAAAKKAEEAAAASKKAEEEAKKKAEDEAAAAKKAEEEAAAAQKKADDAAAAAAVCACVCVCERVCARVKRILFLFISRSPHMAMLN